MFLFKSLLLICV